MSNYKQKIQQNFSDAAERYNSWATSQKKAAETLIKKIKIKNITTVLDIGCGTGILIEQLLRKFPSVKITGVDFAPKMINYCQQQWPLQDFQCTDAEHFKTKQRFDLITSSFTFQWLSDLPKTINKYWALLAPDGQLAIALPLAGSLNELVSAALKANHKLPPLHRLPTEKELFKTIKQLKNCHLKICQKKKITSYYPTPLAALHSIKKIGAFYKNIDRYNYLEMKKLLQNYPQKKFNNEIGAPLTYNVLFIVAEKRER